jgi:Fe-S-cluster containining protein
MAAQPRRITVQVDAALSRLAYRCYPNGCPSDRTCCVGLAVSVSRAEIRVIDSLMDELARIVPGLRQGRRYANVFTDEPGGMQIDPRDERGTCPFLFRKQGRALCSIHHIALRTGREVAAVKPQACRHWPLILERRGRGVRITVHPSAQLIGCVAPLADLPGQPSMRAAFAAEIDELRHASNTACRG